MKNKILNYIKKELKGIFQIQPRLLIFIIAVLSLSIANQFRKNNKENNLSDRTECFIKNGLSCPDLKNEIEKNPLIGLNLITELETELPATSRTTHILYKARINEIKRGLVNFLESNEGISYVNNLKEKIENEPNLGRRMSYRAIHDNLLSFLPKEE